MGDAVGMLWADIWGATPIARLLGIGVRFEDVVESNAAAELGEE